MTKFLVLYMIPVKVVEEWMKTDADQRKAAEGKMMAEWQTWMGEHGSMITVSEAAGKTKRASADGVSDVKNDVMLYSIVEADSHEAAAKAFASHPHLQIPQSSIEIMEVRPMRPG